MAGEYIITLADPAQLEGSRALLKGKFLKGHAQPRIAMVGRSNVGKSSLINAMMGGRLAQVSKEPGKTRSVHFYLWKDAAKIVADLPGYGYARASHEERDRWAEFINAYLRADEGLERVLVLLDSRHGPTAIDLEAIKFMSFEAIPVTFVFTKTDALKNQSERVRRKREATQALKDIGYDPENAFWVSAESRDGLKPLIHELSKKK